MESTGERFMPEWKGKVELEHLNRYYFVVNQIDLKDKKVLDVASGEGYGSNILAKYAHQVIGVDISVEAIEHAKNKYLSKNLTFVHGDVTQIPLKDKSVDVVVSFETIEHHDKHVEMMQEIKRVLSAHGVLVISSPDKYYYSDLPNYNNEFHIKELYYKEFKDLITSHFNNSFFFSQRTFSGSIITLDDNHKKYEKPTVIEKEGIKHFLLPMYNIAIASNNYEFDISKQTIYYTEEDQAITRHDVEHAVYLKEIEIKKTKTWRVGNFLLLPFKLLKNRKT